MTRLSAVIEAREIVELELRLACCSRPALKVADTLHWHVTVDLAMKEPNRDIELRKKRPDACVRKVIVDPAARNVHGRCDLEPLGNRVRVSRPDGFGERLGRQRPILERVDAVAVRVNKSHLLSYFFTVPKGHITVTWGV